MNIRFYNTQLLTFAEDAEITEGELWIQGDTILLAGKPKSRAALVFDREIDARGGVILPGFKNAHTHSAMTFLRGAAEDRPLQEWLHEVVFPAEAQLTAEAASDFMKLAILEYLAGGVTACFDMYLFPYEMARVSAEMGFRTVLCGQLNDFTSDIAQQERDYIALNAYHPLVSYRMGFHAEYTTRKDTLLKLAALAEKYKAPVYTHLSETEKETRDCVIRTGKTPMAYLEEMGIFRYGGGIFHGVYLTKEDMALCRKHGVGVVSNPASNAKLASGIAPLAELNRAGITLALGTDGAASNDALDMFREIYLAAALQKLRQKDAAALDAEKLLYMSTVGGARIMGLDTCDTLQAGKKADLTLIDFNAPNLCSAASCRQALVYSAGRQNVRLTMINGRILYEDGKYADSLDAPGICKRARAAAKQLLH